MEFQPLNITIGIVQSRDGAWVEAALKSASSQVYPIDYDIQVFDNRKKKYLVGKAYNELVKMCKSDWILFLGDDDYIMPDYLVSLTTRYNQIALDDINKDDVVGITTYATLFDSVRKIKQLNQKIIQGMWRREYLIDNQFDEKMVNHVDVDLFERTIEAKKHIYITAWNNGYYYRSHPNQISGEKFENGELNEG